MKLPLSPQELALPYAKYYELPVDGPTEEELHWFDQPLPPDQVLPIDQAANFVKGGNSFIGAPNEMCIRDRMVISALIVLLSPSEAFCGSKSMPVTSSHTKHW